MKEFYKHYLPYIKNYKLKFFYAVIGMLCVAGGTAGTVYIIQPLLDDIFINKDENMLFMMPFIVVGIYFIKSMGGYIQKYYISYIGQDIVRIMRDKLLKHILNLDIAFFQKKHGGELISRITNDVNRIQQAVSNYVADIIREALTIVGLIGVAIYQSPELAFYGLVVLPVALIPLSKLAKKMKKLSFKSQESISDITSHLSETFNNVELIKANSTNEIELKDFEEHNKNFFNVTIKTVRTNALVSAFGSLFLLLVFLNFLFDEEKELHWIVKLEEKIALLGKIRFSSYIVAVIVLFLFSFLVEEDRKIDYFISGAWGILVYLSIQVLCHLLEKNGKDIENMVKTGSIGGFIYLEVLDASFSFDGVIGAFAITKDIIIIMIGLGVGAMFVRSITIYLVEKETLSEYVFLEHGAHYAIGILAFIMLLNVKFHIPEAITGLVGIAFIIVSLYSSIQYNKRDS
jgi:hypothetical protein